MSKFSSLLRYCLCCLALVLAAALLLPSGTASAEDGPVRISEFMAKNKAMLRDEDGDFSDWLELENGSDGLVELSGWQLSDSLSKPGWVLPERTLAPGERLLVFADGKDRREDELHTDFSLSAGETLCLRMPDGSVADKALCSSDLADLSLVRTADGGFAESRYPSPGLPNSAAGYENWQETLYAPGPLVLSEVSVFGKEANFGWNSSEDWVEIHNISGEDLVLGGYSLSDKENDRALWVFPDVTLSAGGYLRVYCAEYVLNELYTGFSLDGEADRLYLSAPDGTLLDYISLRGIPYYGSYGRAADRNGWFYFAEKTPGEENGAGYRRISQAPTALTQDGVFDDVQSVTAEFGGPGALYYTTDGSLPNKDSEHYTGPITLTETCVLRVICIEDGAMPSPALTQSYILNEGHSLPVLSLASDSVANFGLVYNSPWPNVELAGNLALYEADGGFNLPCGIKLNGATSLVLPKKNLSIRFRSAYGASELCYDCFDGGVDHFTNLLLRSGQDYNAVIMRNELCCAMAQKATDEVLVQRFKYCVLYVNGEYRGIYALEEKANEQMFADHLGVSRESVTVSEASVSSQDPFYADVVRPCLETDLSVEENYRAVCEKLDIDSMIDWILVEGWCANKDLTSGNLRYGRSTENDGKWRLMLYDLDATLSHPGFCFDLLNPIALYSRQIGNIIQALLQNEDFRTRLLERASVMLTGPLSNEELLAEMDRLAAQLDPEVDRNHRMIGGQGRNWRFNFENLRDLILSEDWQQQSIDMLCRHLSVTEEERARYFGD